VPGWKKGKEKAKKGDRSIFEKRAHEKRGQIYFSLREEGGSVFRCAKNRSVPFFRVPFFQK
jgi:hypothetical protein